MPARDRKAYIGPAVFSYGFRPFFLMASLLATGIIPVWMFVFSGEIEINSPFAPVDWHIHEMLFGYAAAVVAGFLFTAIPNWTGRMPLRGWPLAGLLILWVIGRVAMSGVLGISSTAVMLLDCAFLAAIVAMIAVEIIAGKNWRNLMVVIPVSLLMAANVVFHLEVQANGTSDIAHRLSIAVVIFLIMLIGGRVIPSFTRNWLAKTGSNLRPIAFNRFDALCLLGGVGAFVLWVVIPDALVASVVLGLVAVLHLARLSRWKGHHTWRSPLLLMLHVAYVFLPVGMLTLALVGQSAGMHLLGIGAIAGMTVAVMMRATMGHTGRDLLAGPWLTGVFSLIILAALTRGFFADIEVFGLSGLWIAAGFWTAGFGGFLLRVGPWLASAKVAPKRAS